MRQAGSTESRRRRVESAECDAPGAVLMGQETQRSGAAGPLARPPALKPGDKVGIVAPCAAVDPENLQRGITVLTSMGYRVEASSKALDRDDILAGTDGTRAAELQGFFADPQIKAIFTARGGYGCGRLLPLLDFAAIARQPKIFVGFSDVTYLLNALVEQSHLICFHGPTVAMDLARGLSAASLAHLKNVLSGAAFPLVLPAQEVLHEGLAHGELIGGCMSVVVAMLGTRYAPSFEGRILFLEDVNERPYRVDRMLTQLAQSGALSKVTGVVFGGMRGYEDTPEEQRLIRRFVREHTCALGVPVLAGLNVGHSTENLTIPLGVPVTLDGQNGRLCFTDRWVS
jgi:muramoyltetrapeptide carboxypeptidase